MPLFISVALSIVILSPMFQVGWLSALLGRDIGELVGGQVPQCSA